MGCDLHPEGFCENITINKQQLRTCEYEKMLGELNYEADGLRLSFAYCGEGYDGDFVSLATWIQQGGFEHDYDDARLLRLDCLVDERWKNVTWGEEAYDGWFHPRNGSACTSTLYGTSRDELLETLKWNHQIVLAMLQDGHLRELPTGF